MGLLWDVSQETFLSCPLGPLRRTWISSMQVCNGLFDNGKIQWYLCFTMGKLKQNIEILVPWFLQRAFPMFTKFRVISSKVSTLFPTREFGQKVSCDFRISVGNCNSCFWHAICCFNMLSKLRVDILVPT